MREYSYAAETNKTMWLYPTVEMARNQARQIALSKENKKNGTTWRDFYGGQVIHENIPILEHTKNVLVLFKG